MSDSPGPPSPEHRLLVLDDDTEVGRTIAAVGRASGLKVTAVTEPEHFFELLEQWRPQLLIVDLVMPSMDGVQVIRSLAQRGTDAKLIISSGVGARVLDAARRTAAEHGLQIMGVLPKPFRPSQLRELIETARRTPSTAAPSAPTRDAETAITAEELHAAVAAREFRVVYQPKVECGSRRLTGFEALVRWHSPARGLVPPDHFIPLAERCGAIHGITTLVLENSLAWLAGWFPDSTVGLSVNVSGACFGQTDFPEEVQRLCRSHGIAHDRLTLELTETAAMRDPVAALAQLTQLRMRGFELSIDDFGTGYSSMVQLVRLPFSELKIDRSFVRTAGESEESRAVVSCIMGLAKSLSMSVTAEGVEDLAVMPLLVEVGCERAQGYGIGRPLNEAGVPEWMRRWERAGQWT